MLSADSAVTLLPVSAYVVRREGVEVTAAELIDYTHDRLAACKRPREVVFVPAFPATSTGKIMRRRLADARAEALSRDRI